MTFEDPSQTKKKVCTACKREFPATQSVCPYDKSMLMYLQKDELLGTILNDRYRVLEEVGRGGMSIVYRGIHEMMDRTVAIKMLQAQHVSDQLSIKRFQQEAQAASHLQHPHVITVYDCGVVATGQPYIVMDFLEGESLSDVIKKDNHIPFPRAVPIFAQACDALDHAHQKGVIHRDLKSSNIMLVEVEGRKDFVKVVDFGIAKLTNASGRVQQNLTQTGEIFGSPIYMSPEQCLGQTLDTRSDIYSMGAVLYESLTGLPPLMGDTIYATMKMHVSEMPERFANARPDLRIPEQIEQIAFKALAKKPEQRYQSMQEFRDALESCMRTQFDTGAMPSLLSAPPSVGFNTLAPSSGKELEDFDLSGGLFGDDPPPVSDKPSFRRTDGGGTYGGGSDVGSTAGRVTMSRTTRPPAVGSETGRRTAGVRKPMASDKKPGRSVKLELPAWVNKRNMSIAGIAVLVPSALAGVMVLLNQLGNDNPLLFVKKYQGTVFYYAPPQQTADGKEFLGMFYVRTSGNQAKMLKVDLSKYDISNHVSSSKLSDVRVGALWDLQGPMGANNSLLLEQGQFIEQDENTSTYLKARDAVENFILSVRDNQKYAGLLRSAWELTTERYRTKDMPMEDFMTKFLSEPNFKPDFTESYLPPGSLMITEAKPTTMTFLVDGHYFIMPDSQNNTVYYSVTLNYADSKWQIDKFENVTEKIWREHLPK